MHLENACTCKGSSPVFFLGKENMREESMLRKRKYKNIDFTEFVV